MPAKHHFNLRAFAIVVAPINFPMPPGGHLWKKMKPYCNPAALKEALLQDKRFVFEKELLDYEGDIVGYSFETKNMAQFRNAVKKTLGKDHGLIVTEMGSSSAVRKMMLQTYRKQGNFKNWWLSG